ncbi:MAG: hypothetical protein ABIS92_13715 [Polyangia bacterium]
MNQRSWLSKSSTVPTRPTNVAYFLGVSCSAVLIALGGCGSSSASSDAGSGGAGGRAAARTDGGNETGGATGSGGTGVGGSDDGTGGAALPGSGGAAADVDGGGTDAPAAGAPKAALDLCRSFCDRVTKCDTSRDQQTCLNACTNSNAALFPKLRADIVASIAGCVLQKDCATISLDVSLRTCAGEAAAIIGPSATATAFCSAADTAQTQCGVTIDKADCLTSAKVYSDATLTDAMACTTKSCSLIYPCASATLNTATGSWSLGAGIKPGKKCAGTANPCNYFSSQMTQCQAAGCTYAATCSGSPNCFFSSTMPACQAMAGCTWNATSLMCTGNPTVTCAAQTTPTACQQLIGCFPSGTCTGTVPLCTTVGVTACATHPGCMVMDAM